MFKGKQYFLIEVIENMFTKVDEVKIILVNPVKFDSLQVKDAVLEFIMKTLNENDDLDEDGHIMVTRTNMKRNEDENTTKVKVKSIN